MEEEDSAPGPSSSPSKICSKQPKSIRLECEVCGLKYSSARKTRQPVVGKCGHSFCTKCAKKLNGKCARCRNNFKPVKNFALIDTLEELKEVKDTMKKKRDKMKEMKKKMREAGMEVSDDSDDEESEEEQEGGEEAEGAEENEEAEPQNHQAEPVPQLQANVFRPNHQQVNRHLFYGNAEHIEVLGHAPLFGDQDRIVRVLTRNRRNHDGGEIMPGANEQRGPADYNERAHLYRHRIQNQKGVIFGGPAGARDGIPEAANVQRGPVDVLVVPNRRIDRVVRVIPRHRGQDVVHNGNGAAGNNQQPAPEDEQPGPSRRRRII